MTTPIPAGAQVHLAAVSEHLRSFEDDHSLGFGLLVLAGDMRSVAEAAARAAEVITAAAMKERGES